MTVASVSLFRFRVPLARPLPVGGATLRGRDGWLVRLEDAAGRAGWGEAAPLPGFSTEDAAAAGAALRALAPGLVGTSVDAADPASAPPSVRFAVGAARAALADAPTARAAIPLNGLLLGDAAAVRDAARRRYDAGYRVLKLKVGRRAVDDETALVRALADALPGVALRLDANRAWSWDEAVRFARGVDGAPIDYLEEPLAAPERLPALAAETGLPLALDESLAGLAPDALADRPWVRAVVLKPTLLGWDGTRAWMDAAVAHGVRAALSSAFETGVGLAAIVRLAAGGDGTPAGLDTLDWLADDVLDRPLVLGPRVDVAAALLAGSRVRRHALEPTGRWPR